MVTRWLTPASGRLANRIAKAQIAVSVALSTLFAAGAVAPAQASDKPQVLVFAARARETKMRKGDELATHEVRAALERLELAELLPAPALDLEAMQLTIDCVGETAECLGQVAKASHARVLIVPSIERRAGTTSLRILYFDAEAGAEPRKVVRSAKGKELAGSVVDAIPEMLRELFPAVAEPEPEQVETEPDSITPLEVQSEPVDVIPIDEPHRPSLVGPVVLGVGGLIVVGAGVTVGLLMKHTEDSYASREVQTPAQAERADDQRKSGQRQALVANLLLGAGAAVVIAGVIWYAAGLGSEPKPAQTTTAMLVPSVTTHSAGLALVGVWEDRL